MEVLKKLKIEQHNPAIPLLGIYLEKRKTLTWKYIDSLMFITTLFTVAKILKQPKLPLMDKWVKKMWYMCACTHTHTHTHTHSVKMEYCSAIRKNEILPFEMAWMDLEGIMLSEISQRTTILYNLTYMWNI